jgi:hypothetical protein
VFITAGPSTMLFAWGGGGYGSTCATRDDEPRPVWTRLPITHKLDKKYFTFGRSLKDLPNYSMVLQRSGKITRLASS